MGDGSFLKTLEAFEAAGRGGIHPGLSGIRALLGRLGNPERGLRVIHIAGTNGKGSVSAMLRSVFLAAGYSPGVFNSPALRDYREQILAKDKMITKSAFVRLGKKVLEACESMEQEGLPHPSRFEMDLAMACLYFKEKGSDPVIAECGMGGGSDSTNVLPGVVLSVITSVSMDHMQFLGRTLEKIAEAKAGIIRTHVPVCSAPQMKEAAEVISRVAEEKEAPLFLADPAAAGKPVYGLQSVSFTYPGFPRLKLSLGGEWQLENACLLLECVKQLRGTWRLSDEVLKKGLAAVSWQGRFEVIRKKPLFIMDGAHNPGGAARLAGTLKHLFPGKSMVFLVGMLKDKDAEGVLRETLPLAQAVVTLKPPGNPRAMDALDLAEIAGRFHPKVTSADSLEEALEMGELLRGEDGMTVAFGSLSFLAPLKELVCG